MAARIPYQSWCSQSKPFLFGVAKVPQPGTPFVSIETLYATDFLNMKYVNSDENSRFGNREQPQRVSNKRPWCGDNARSGEESASSR